METYIFSIAKVWLVWLHSPLSEIDAGPIPLPNDKALKEKKRKLKETLDRMLRLYVSPVAEIFILKTWMKTLSVIFSISRLCYTVVSPEVVSYKYCSTKWGQVSKENMVLHWWGVLQDNLVLSTELIIGTFRSEDEDDYEYEFSVLSMRIRFLGRHFSKCACSEQKTRSRPRPRPPI